MLTDPGGYLLLTLTTHPLITTKINVLMNHIPIPSTYPLKLITSLTEVSLLVYLLPVD